MCRYIIHETLWNSSTTGTEADESCRTNEKTLFGQTNCRSVERNRIIRKTMEKCLPTGRTNRLKSHCRTRQAGKIDKTTKAKPDCPIAERRNGKWLWQRIVDMPANRGTDKTTLWRKLS